MKIWAYEGHLSRRQERLYVQRRLQDVRDRKQQLEGECEMQRRL
jgi:hypothetical protein